MMRNLMKPGAIWAAAILCVFYIPLVLLGDQIYVLVRDGLECEVIWLHLLKMNGHLFSGSGAIIQETMGGLEARHFHSPLNLNRVVFWMFNSVTAYVVLTITYRLLAIWGAWSLLQWWKKSEGLAMDWADVFLVAGFSLLMTTNLYGLSALGVPMLYYLFHQVGRGKSKIVHWVGLFFYGFTVHLAMALISVGLIWFVVFISNESHKNRQFIVRMAFAGLVSVIGLGLGSYMQVIDTLLGSIVSHRVERVWDARFFEFSWTRYVALHGHHHSGKVPFVVCFLLAGILVVWDFIYGQRRFKTWMSWLAGYAAVLVLFHIAKPFAGNVDVEVLKKFDLQRVHFLLPFIAFGFVARHVWAPFLLRLVVAIVWLLVVVKSNNELRSNWAQIILGRSDNVEYVDRLTEESLWSQIRSDHPNINRVGMSGVPNWVAQWNGIPTLGGYQNDYPLAYKHAYREVIKDEMSKDAQMEHRYDIWGNKCHLKVVGGPGDMALRLSLTPDYVAHPSWNFDAMRDLGCSHVISGYPIATEDMTLAGKYRGFYWDIYVYALK